MTTANFVTNREETIKLPTSASFLVSEKCNLHCSYCFEKAKDSKNMSKEVALESMDLLYRNALENKKNGFSSNDDISVNITMFGGEPMINFDVMKFIFDKSVEYKEKTGISFSSSIITNGTIIDREIVDYLKEFNRRHHSISIQLSVDGIKMSHDFYRKFTDGRGSFDIIENNIPLFKEIFKDDESHKSSRQRDRLNIHGSLNKETMKTMYESWKYFNDEWHLPAIWFMPVHSESWSEEDVEIYEEQLIKIANDILIKCVMNHTDVYVSDYAPLNKCIAPEKSSFPKPCGAGDSYISFTAEGKIYACHQFYFIDKSLSIGDIYSGIDENRRKLYSTYNSDDMNCAKLDCKNTTCYRCIAENYSSTGTLLNCDITHRCKMSTIEKRLLDKMRQILAENNIGSAK